MQKKNNTEFGKVESVKVLSVRAWNNIVFFSMALNGVIINNCKVVEGKNGDFISLPSYKGTDEKYYSHVYFKFSPEDMKKILGMVQAELDK